jgi:2-iminobutanoate/2-iminopropanoate deaminase
MLAAWAHIAMCKRLCLALLQTKDLIGDDIEVQTDQALKNLGAILEAAGSSYSQVLKTTVLLTDMGDFAKVNGVYGESFHRKQGPNYAP